MKIKFPNCPHPISFFVIAQGEWFLIDPMAHDCVYIKHYEGAIIIRENERPVVRDYIDPDKQVYGVSPTIKLDHVWLIDVTED